MKIFLSLFYFSYFALVGVYIVFVPKVLLDFEYTKLQIGIIGSAAPFMRFLLPFIFKHYIELTQYIFRLALLFTFIGALLLLGTVENFWTYLIANLLFGAAMGVILPFVETIALSTLSKKLYGKIRLWGSVGFIVVVLALGELNVSSTLTFYCLSILAFFTFLFGYFIVHKENVSKGEEEEKSSAFSLKKYWAFWISIFLMQVAFGGFYIFFTIYAEEQGFSSKVVSYLWSFGVICEIVMLYFQGALLQRNLLTILKVATLITSFRWLLLYLYPSSLYLTFLGQSLHAVSFALYHTAAITYVFFLYTQKRLAQQFFLGISFGLGGALGAFIAGVVFESYPKQLFLVESFIALIAFLMLLVHTKRKNQSKVI